MAAKSKEALSDDKKLIELLQQAAKLSNQTNGEGCGGNCDKRCAAHDEVVKSTAALITASEERIYNKAMWVVALILAFVAFVYQSSLSTQNQVDDISNAPKDIQQQREDTRRELNTLLGSFNTHVESDRLVQNRLEDRLNKQLTDCQEDVKRLRERIDRTGR